MLGRVDAQGSLLETRWVRRHLVTKGSFYERLAVHGHEIVCDDDFAHLYAEDRGRPSVPPSVMVRAMLCATHDRTSDRESARRTRVDLDWKAAMGVGDEFEGIGATTFALMRARMVAADADGELFKATLTKAVQAGVLRGKLTAIIDSSPVHGAGAVADTYELIRGFLRQVVRAAGGQLDTGSADVGGAVLRPEAGHRLAGSGGTQGPSGRADRGGPQGAGRGRRDRRRHGDRTVRAVEAGDRPRRRARRRLQPADP